MSTSTAKTADEPVRALYRFDGQRLSLDWDAIADLPAGVYQVGMHYQANPAPGQPTLSVEIWKHVPPRLTPQRRAELRAARRVHRELWYERAR